MPAGKLSLSKKAAAIWKSRIAEAVSDGRERKPVWEHLIRRYSGKRPESIGVNFPVDWVEVNKFFPLVEHKKANLFYRLPKVQVTPDAVLTETFAEQAVAVAEALEDGINKRIGLHGLNVLPDIQKALFDVLCPAGLGAVEIGYRTVMKPVTFEVGETDPRQPTVQALVSDPLTGEPMVDEAGQPQTQEQPNVLQEPFNTEVAVHEEWFFDHFSIDNLIVPRGFKSTDYSKADWLGVRFSMPLPHARNIYKLPKTFKPTGNPEDKEFDLDDSKSPEATTKVEGIRIWYRASAFDAKETNPDIFYRIVFINGLETPAEPTADSLPTPSGAIRFTFWLSGISVGRPSRHLTPK
jgi:hypothetical protein